MPKITTLTPEQEAELPRFRQRYLDIACNGGRIDREALEAALADAYAVIGKPAPRLFIFDSPVACMLALKTFRMPAAKGQLWDQLSGQLRGQLSGQLRGQLRGQLSGQLWGQLSGQLWGQLSGQKIYDGNCLWGSQDLYWVAWAKFAASIGVTFAPDTAARLDIMDRIGRQCEWWWPCGGVVIASERPVRVRWDDNRRLHAEDGPAVAYADGYEMWSWHGVRVPRDWIAEKAIKAADALRWPNIEQRRAACEILGWATILDELGSKTIDRDANPEIGELVRVKIPDIGTEQFLRVRCGTGRDFALPVPPDMKTARQANAWTYGFDNPEDYQLEIRT